MKTIHKKIVKKLNALVGCRFNENSLNTELSKIFDENIKVELITNDIDELTDFNYLFCSENPTYYGFFDIYFLKMRSADLDGSDIYVTEISHDFDFHSY